MTQILVEVKLQLVFLQDPVMPSQEPPPEDKSEDELADVHGEDTDGSETSFCSNMSCSGQTRRFAAEDLVSLL